MKTAYRLYFSVGSGDCSKLRLSFFAWYLGSNLGPTPFGNGYAINLISLECNGVSAPVTFSAGRTASIANGATDIQTDDILPASFGLLKFAQGMQGYLRIECTFSAPTTDRSTGNASEAQGGLCYEYDPNKASLINGIDSTGPITYSLINGGVDGVNIKRQAFPMAPAVLGKFINGDPTTWIIAGDSGAYGTGGNVSSEGSRGLSYAMYPNPAAVSSIGAIANWNLGCNSGAAVDWANGTPQLLNSYLKYFNSGIDEYGGNGLNVPASQAIWATMRASGIKNIIRTSLTPRTTPNTGAFCPIAISSLTSVGTTATATVASTANLTSGQTYPISGATPAAYNGSYVITVTNATTFTYTFAGGTSPATGTIVADDQFRTDAFQVIDTGPGWGPGGAAATFETSLQALVAADLVYMDYHTPLASVSNYWLWRGNGAPFFMGGDGLHPSNSGYVNGKALGTGTVKKLSGTTSTTLQALIASYA